MLTARITVVRNKGSLAGAYRFIGRGRGGAFLTLVVAATGDPSRWRPVTGWPSTEEERKRYGE